MRNLRVQEFLRELVVGVAAPSDLAGSIIVEILQVVKGRRASVLEPRNTSPVFVIAYLFYLCLYLACLYCSYLYMLDILVLNCNMLGIV